MDMYSNASVAAISAGILGIFYLIYIAILVLIIVGTWKVFVKAGKPGWASLIPFYSQYCLFDIACGNGWFFLLMFVPCVNFFALIYAYIKLAQAFGKGTGYGIAMFFFGFVLIPMLGFGDAQYVGPQ